MIVFAVTIWVTVLIFFISKTVTEASSLLVYSVSANIITFLILLYTLSRREEVSTFSIPVMSNDAGRLAKKLKRLFNDKQITDVLILN